MAQEQFTHGYALLIGVNDNLIPRYALPAVARDTAALQTVLTHPERCAYPAANVRLLNGSEASRQGIYGGLSWLKERLAADRSDNATAVLYYSGHGAYSRDDNGYYILPYDLRQPLINSLIHADELAAAVEQVRPRRLLVILDCCHAGGMSIKGDDLLADGLSKAAAPSEARSVVALMRGQGRAVLSSSTAAESSYVRPDRKMSVFTYHLIEALTGHAAAEGATDVLVSDVMGYVSRAVPRSVSAAYNVSQTPVYEVSGENFPAALLLGGLGLAKGQPPPDPLVPPGDQAGGASPSGGNGKYVMSGDFRGAVLNIESQLSHVTQSILSAPVGDAAGRADLNGLIAGLQIELECVPADQSTAAEQVAARLARLGGALADGDRELATIGCAGLERAADALGNVRPGIPAAAHQLTAAIRAL